MRKLLGVISIIVLTVAVGFGQQSQAPPVSLQNPPLPPPTANQNSQNPPRGKISVTVNLVLVDARVTDRNGKPIRGLKPEQFTVLENDKPQRISSFEYFDASATETASAGEHKQLILPLSGLKPTQDVQRELPKRRLIVLFYDLTSMQPDQLLRAVSSGEEFLQEQLSPADLVSVVTFGNQLSVLTSFIDNRATLLRAVRSIRLGKDAELATLDNAATVAGQVSAREDTSAAFESDETEFNIFNTDRKLMALESLAQLLREIPGKKSVIHYTGGISQTGEENRSQLIATTDASNRSNVSIYTVDMRGLYATIPGGDASIGAPQKIELYNGAAVLHQTEMRHLSRDTLVTLAVDTGGKAFFDRGDFHEVYQTVQDEGTGYYLLGYYSTDPKTDGRWRRSLVKVNVPGAHVQSRQGYYADRDTRLATAKDRQEQLGVAMRSESPRVELPVALSTSYFRLSDREYFVPLDAKLDSSALEWAEKKGNREAQFQFAAEVRDEKTHKIVSALQDSITVNLADDRFKQVQRRPLVYQGGVILPPGQYRLKFLAREDSSGRIGSFEEDLNLPIPQMGQLELSSVLLSNQLDTAKTSSEVKRSALGPDAKLKTTPLDVSGGRIIPNVTRVFTPQQKLLVYFQAYLPDKLDSSNLRAGLVFYCNGEWVSETPLATATDVDLKTRVASFRVELPLEKFPVGQYEVRAIAVNAAGEQAAFGQNRFALQLAPPAVAGASTGSGN
ncbi:MAG TPA: VWA domain-containing protein [Candidatus Acidoferrales bacterium]|nr:VWA domain-containing protein [Candidatus Acidoferrales bacterium]